MSYDACVIEGCTRKVRTRGYCRRCLQAGYEDGSIPKIRGPRGVCIVDSCSDLATSKKMCGMHYARLVRNGSTDTPTSKVKYVAPDGSRVSCSVHDCSTAAVARSLCSRHYSILLRGGDPEMSGRTKKCPVTDCWRDIGIKAGLCTDHNRTKWLYGLTQDQFLEMNLPENKMCGNSGCGGTEELGIDHDHSCCSYTTFNTKYSCGNCVRGWLCRGCNVALGHLQENPDKIRGLVAYLGNSRR